MSQIIKTSRLSISRTLTAHLLLAIPLVIGLALAADIWPLDRKSILTNASIAILLCAGVLGVYHLADFLLFRRYRGELHFDGTTVVSMVPGHSPQAFTKSDVLAYFPYRNEVLLIDGRHISLPACAPQYYFDEFDMASPWVSAWWPEVNLYGVIAAAESRQGWIRHTPAGITALAVTTLVLLLYYQSSSVTAAMVYTLLFLQLTIPEWLESRLRRRVMITLEHGPTPRVDQAVEQVSGANTA